MKMNYPLPLLVWKTIIKIITLQEMDQLGQMDLMGMGLLGHMDPTMEMGQLGHMDPMEILMDPHQGGTKMVPHWPLLPHKSITEPWPPIIL